VILKIRIEDNCSIRDVRKLLLLVVSSFGEIGTIRKEKMRGTVVDRLPIVTI
jgi:hypothetical protein